MSTPANDSGRWTRNPSGEDPREDHRPTVQEPEEVQEAKERKERMGVSSEYGGHQQGYPDHHADEELEE